jgi:putative methionine-R-sulfoxide reductase with GAF domain
MLELHEIIDISEDGVAIQCDSPLEANQRVDLCLDLAESSGQIFTAGQVIWSSASGRAGLRFSDLPPASLFRLREWLFLNAMAGVANAEAEAAAASPSPARRDSGQRDRAEESPSKQSPSKQSPVDSPIESGPTESGSAQPTPLRESAVRPNFTDTLAALTAVQREVESLGANLAAALKLIAARAQTLVRASGAAIALAELDPDFMVCRASAGLDAPPLRARLQVGSGFSGECVRTGRLLRCDDTETDNRVDRDSCRALGIRSMLAVPIRRGNTAIGLLEVFSAHPGSFTENDSTVLQRLAETILAALNRAARSDNGAASAPNAVPVPASQGSVLFGSNAENKVEPESHGHGDIRLPRSLLIILICAAATIALALGFLVAPWIEARVNGRGDGREQTVLASSPSSSDLTSATNASTAAVDSATLTQLEQLAEKGNPVAQNALGLHYATGEGVKLDERAAARWFTKAAEQGNVNAQSKLGSLYWVGRGVPQNLNQAYFWTALARAGGDDGSKALATVLASHMSRAQSQAIEQQAEIWLQQHQPAAKPRPGR